MVSNSAVVPINVEKISPKTAASPYAVQTL
jgi:hypothetical protein